MAASAFPEIDESGIHHADKSLYIRVCCVQLHLHVQIRILDNSYISNTQFISLAEEVAEKCGIKYQESVRRGGSTNAAKISVTGKAVPCLVLGVPSRYAHSHYNFCAREDLEAASAMAANVIRALDEEKIRHICHQDVL